MLKRGLIMGAVPFSFTLCYIYVYIYVYIYIICKQSVLTWVATCRSMVLFGGVYEFKFRLLSHTTYVLWWIAFGTLSIWYMVFLHHGQVWRVISLKDETIHHFANKRLYGMTTYTVCQEQNGCYFADKSVQYIFDNIKGQHLIARTVPIIARCQWLPSSVAYIYTSLGENGFTTFMQWV